MSVRACHLDYAMLRLLPMAHAKLPRRAKSNVLPHLSR